MAAFRLGRRCYEAQQFALARQFSTKYLQKVNYNAFTQDDRRPVGDSHPRWSVIIVSYCAAKDLLECLDSVFAQTCADYEVILVDNGGNESIRHKLMSYPLLYIAPPQNMLPSEGRNIGGHFAKGRYLAFVDDDGLIVENYLEEGEKALSQPKVVGARGRIVPKTEGGASNTHYDLGSEPRSASLTLEGNMVIHRDLYLEVGGFDPLMFGHEGKELECRLKRIYKGHRSLYWPALELKHDFAKTTRLDAKLKRQEAGTNYIKQLTSKVEEKPLMKQTKNEEKTVSTKGISVVVRAGNNEQAARTFLGQFVNLNTYKPIEAFFLFNKPAAEHLRLMAEFATKVRVAVIKSNDKTLADLAKSVRYDTLLLVSTPAEVKEDCLSELWKRLNSGNNALLSVPTSNLSNSALLTKEAALRLGCTPAHAGDKEIEAGLSDIANSSSEKPESLKHWKIEQEGAPLDTQIEVLEAELERKDNQLAAIYANIEALDKEYDALPPEEEQTKGLKSKLKSMVEDSNNRLKDLKAMHDQLEYLRIRKYSLSA